MTELSVVISGTGRMGRQVAAAVLAEPGMTPAAYIDGLSERGAMDGIPVFREAGAGLDEAKPHVVVDFTNAAWTPVIAKAALERGIPMVIGTTGLPAEFMGWLEREAAARGVGVVVAANFAISAVLMMHFAKQAARFFDSAEIIELHHDGKVDSPSGTAKATAEGMVAARGRPFEHRVPETETVPGARGAELGGVAIHAVRLPGLVAHQEVIFGGLGQVLTIRQDSLGRDSFMPGVLLAIREVVGRKGLVVGLERLLGLE
ncbi:4-hydroxy-tetrahydrodipicolinate reductase [Tepidiforma sp.]|uniref:4-hydroxy-tetrahydrodipicolinate reductase n=1 Tax=Tepidiforma sp. TaxID=2682230 RepID=UPI002626747B|nr:4-hydroxy-tetrahydrodipicolinate reductase [Tepidiforma sp.]MCX7618563.1 4-hydroxy-tetrahydrodipicolinate reductase [Tepidiforma sp.]